MNVRDFYNNLSLFYKRALNVFEKGFIKYAFSFFDMSEYERVYVVEDSFIVYFGIKKRFEITDTVLYNHLRYPYGECSTLIGHILVIEELTYNYLFKSNASKLKREIFGKDASYAPYIYKFFNANIDSPVRALNPSEEKEFKAGMRNHLKTNFYTVSNAFPFLKLKNRVENWEGVPHTIIVFKASFDGETGFAVCYTTSPFVMRYIMEKIGQINTAIRYWYFLYVKDGKSILGMDNMSYEMTLFEGITLYHFPYELNKGFSWERICYNDLSFKRVLLRQLDLYYSENNIDYKTSHDLKPQFIKDYSLEWFIIHDAIIPNRLPKEVEIFDNLDSFICKSVEHGFYTKSESKWKSEELMYTFVKRIFFQSEVITQHKPFFLKTERGQLSLDVFVCNEKIAFEYQGKQHFEPVEYFGGEQHFVKQRENDEKKRMLCEKNGITLIYVNYWEDVTKDLIETKVYDALKDRRGYSNKYYIKSIIKKTKGQSGKRQQ